MNLAVTATQGGLTYAQRALALDYLSWVSEDMAEFHHGGCVGGDDELQHIVAEIQREQLAGLRRGRTLIIMHRGSTPEKWADCNDNADRIIEPKDNIERNHDMVDKCDELLACPGEMTEVLRSGTWATIRYARRQGKKLTIIYPDGSRGE